MNYLNKLPKKKKTLKIAIDFRLKPKVLLRRTKPRLGRIISIIFLGFFVYGVYFFFLESGFFNVSKVIVSGFGEYVNGYDLKTISETNALGKNIFLLNTKNISEVVKNNFLAVKSVHVKKRFPRNIDIYIEERIPLAAVFDNAHNLYVVDNEGFVLGVTDERVNTLPTIDYEGEVLIGQPISGDIVPVYMEIVANIKKQKLSVSSVSITDSYSSLYLDDNMKVIIGNKKDITKTFDVISSLVTKLKLESKKAIKIDLRYDKVIVLYD